MSSTRRCLRGRARAGVPPTVEGRCGGVAAGRGGDGGDGGGGGASSRSVRSGVAVSGGGRGAGWRGRLGGTGCPVGRCGVLRGLRRAGGRDRRYRGGTFLRGGRGEAAAAA